MSNPQTFSSTKRFFRKNTPRRGVFVLELVLLLPVILLVLMILYQVSIMMTSYQVMRMAVFNASRAAAEASNSGELETDVSQAIKTSVENYFLGRGLSLNTSDKNIIYAASKTEWESEKGRIKYRILKLDENDQSNPWKYLAKDSLPDGIFALEVKFQNLDDFTSYWVLPLFTGVDEKNASMVLSQVTSRGNAVSGTAEQTSSQNPEQSAPNATPVQISL